MPTYHTNFQLLTSSDQNGPVKECLNGYLTKKSEVILEGAAPEILVAVSHSRIVKAKRLTQKLSLEIECYLCKDKDTHSREDQNMR